MSQRLPRRLEDLPPRHRAEAEIQLGAGSLKKQAIENQTENVRPALSTDEEKLNKTERAFLAWLRGPGNWYWIGVQNVTLKLADDCRYTPDFCALKSGPVTFFEVKGFWRDDARVKIKVAARMFVWAKFIAVQRVKGEWRFEEIKP